MVIITGLPVFQVLWILIELSLFNKYNLKPEECFFVDDKEKNINAGKRLGMNGHVLDYENNKADELIKDLSANGVEI